MRFAFTAAIVLAAQLAFAHDGITDQIARISAQLQQDPANASLLVRRAELYRAARQPKKAFADLDRAVTLDPTIKPDLLCAQLHFDEANWRAAVDAASRVLARQPRDPGALIVRARAQARLGRGRQAAADFTGVLEQRPAPDLYLERARALRADGPNGVTEALRSLDEGLVRLGPLVTLELEAIDLELRLARYDAALARLDRISAQSARKDTWLARRGAILERAGRVEDARAAYRAALASAESQPPRIRQTRAFQSLVDRLHADLDRLSRSSH